LIIIMGAVCLYFAAARRLGEEKFRKVCRSNLYRIYEAVEEYQQRYGQMPPELKVLEEVGLIAPGRMICMVDVREPHTATTNYLYVSNLPTSPPSHWIVAFDGPENHPNGGRYVVRADGRADELDADAFRTAFEEFREDFTRVTGTAPTIVGGDVE
jgi:hypothetical protein